MFKSTNRIKIIIDKDYIKKCFSSNFKSKNKAKNLKLNSVNLISNSNFRESFTILLSIFINTNSTNINNHIK